MTKQAIWDSIITPQAKARMKRMTLAEQLAAARAQASLRHDQRDIQDAFACDCSDMGIPITEQNQQLASSFSGDRHYQERKNHKGHES